MRDACSVLNRMSPLYAFGDTGKYHDIVFKTLMHADRSVFMAAGCGSGAAAADAGGDTSAGARTGRASAASGRPRLCAHIAGPGAPGYI